MLGFFCMHIVVCLFWVEVYCKNSRIVLCFQACSNEHFRSRDVMTSYNAGIFRFFREIFVILEKHLNESKLIKINSIEAENCDLGNMVFKIRIPWKSQMS